MSPKSAEQRVETVCHCLVIVSLQHTDEQALAESTGTDIEQIVRLLLQQRQIHRLVYIIQIPFSHRHEVGHTVGHLLYLFHCFISRLYSNIACHKVT